MKIGVLGGTFDPIHRGHLIVAEQGRLQLGLERVIFVPAGQPWLKTDRIITPAIHRAEMVKLSIIDYPYFEVSTLEVDKRGPSYSVDTMSMLQVQLGSETELYLLMGWDSLGELPQWKEPRRLVKVCRIAAFNRPGYSRPNLTNLEESIPEISRSVVWVDIKPIDISSSDIRSRIRQGLLIDSLVPEVVARYIEDHKLYLLGVK
jgi:nicotinate-nucleotide adenylyltransferase